MLVVLWVVESIEPAINVFQLKVAGDAVADLRLQIESVLRDDDLRFELRTSSAGEVAYEVRLPTATRTDRISRSIAALREPAPAINWEKK